METHPALEIVESIVLDGVTGERVYPSKTIARGSIRNETIQFRVHAPLGKLRRKTTVQMRMLGMWQQVSSKDRSKFE